MLILKKVHNQKQSFLHNFDSRVKILLALLYTIVIFIVSHPVAALGMSLGFIVLWFVSQLKIRKIFTYLKFLLIMVLFITILQMLFGPGDHYIVKPLIPVSIPLIGGKGSLKWDGLLLGVSSGLRLLSLVLVLPMLIAATPMSQLAQGLTGLRLNYKTAFIISSAINLVPALEEEARCIIDAQKLRGLHAFDRGNFWGKLKAYPALAVPLIISAMKRSKSMAYAMDSRAFGAYPVRSWRQQLKAKSYDLYAVLVSVIFCGFVLALNFAMINMWQ